MAQLVARASLAPAGRHVARLDRVEDHEASYGSARKWSKSYRWVFLVVDGQYADQELIRVTGQELRAGTSLGKLVESLYGRPIKIGEAVDPIADCVGRNFEIFAIPGDDGAGAVVTTITPITTTKE